MARSNISRFKKWLTEHGAVVLDPTNEWEVVRFRTDNGVSVVYVNKKGYNKFTGESQEAWDAFNGRRPWKAINRPRERLKARKTALAQRDGHKCFGCWRPIPLDDLTIEHILNFSHGGSDHESNLCLCCDECQGLLGNLPITRKFRIIMEQRLKYKDETTKKSGPTATLVSTPSGENFFQKIWRKHMEPADGDQETSLEADTSSDDVPKFLREQDEKIKAMTPAQFAEQFSDMPDGAFWALAEEYGLYPEDFTNDNQRSENGTV